jgi:hypothetical protein
LIPPDRQLKERSWLFFGNKEKQERKKTVDIFLQNILESLVCISPGRRRLKEEVPLLVVRKHA